MRLEKKLDLILKSLGVEHDEEPRETDDKPVETGRKAKVLKFLRPRRKTAMLDAEIAAKSAEKR